MLTPPSERAEMPPKKLVGRRYLAYHMSGQARSLISNVDNPAFLPTLLEAGLRSVREGLKLNLQLVGRYYLLPKFNLYRIHIT